MSEDQNLLLGLIALQLDFVDRSTLVDALDAWSADKSQSLGQVLIARGKLSADDLTLLESLVRKQLSRHSQDAKPGLAAVGALVDPTGELTTGMRSTHSISGADATPPFVPGTHSSSLGTEGTGRFKVLRPFARGGLGLVSIALDQELQREVALKEIQPRFAGDVSSQRRFLFEAEITGRLEHPGIVPVYGLGRRHTGEPYYAMRLIQGESLQEALLRLHQANSRPEARLWELRKLLQRFVVVANVMAYAHSRGVLHRDLKPHNIMLGRYGETLVVDWGLARVLTQNDHVPQAEPVAAVKDEAHATLVGAILGTPAFMSPEQASGLTEGLTPASDIYGLGATLYALLTGRAPVVESDKQAILERVRNADFPKPRELQRWIPAALQAITLRAMARVPSHRFPSAAELAAELESWLADEPVRTYREPWPVRLSRWARRRRSLVAAAATLLASVFVALSISTWALNRERLRTEHQRTKAAYHFGQARNVVQQFLTEVGAIDLAHTPQLGPQRRRLLELARDYYARFLEEGEDHPDLLREAAQAYANLGNIHRLMGQHDESIGAYQDLIRLVSEAGGLDSWEPAGLNLASAYQELGILAQEGGRLDEAEGHYGKADQMLQRAPALARTSPQYRLVLANLAENRANLLRDRGRSEQAIPLLMESIGTRARLVDEAPDEWLMRRKFALSQANLAVLLADARRYPEAEAAIERAVTGLETLLQEEPAELPLQQELAIALNTWSGILLSQGRLVLAEVRFRRAAEILDTLLAANPKSPFLQHERAQSGHNLAICLNRQQRWPEAETVLSVSVSGLEKLCQDYSGNPTYAMELAQSRLVLSEIQFHLGKSPESLAECRRSVDLAEQLVQRDPENRPHRLVLSKCQIQLAHLLAATGSYSECPAWFDSAADTLQVLLSTNSNDVPARVALGDLYYRRAQISFLQRDLASAAADFQAAADTQERLATEESGRNELAAAAAMTWVNLAAVRTQLGASTAAMAAWENALRHARRIVVSEPQSVVYRSILAQTYRGLMEAHAQQGNHAGIARLAEEHASQLPLLVDDALIAAQLLANCQSAVRQDKGLNASQQEKLVEEYDRRAIAELRRAVKLGLRDPHMLDAETGLGPLRERQEFKELIEEMESARGAESGKP